MWVGALRQLQLLLPRLSLLVPVPCNCPVLRSGLGLNEASAVAPTGGSRGQRLLQSRRPPMMLYRMIMMGLSPRQRLRMRLLKVPLGRFLVLSLGRATLRRPSSWPRKVQRVTMGQKLWKGLPHLLWEICRRKGRGAGREKGRGRRRGRAGT